MSGIRIDRSPSSYARTTRELYIPVVPLNSYRQSVTQRAHILYARVLYVRADDLVRAPEVQNPTRKALADIKIR